MTRAIKLTAALVALLALGACVEDTGGSMNSDLSGTPDQFASMRQPCISQAARMTGVPNGAIRVLDQIQTGGGPILTLDAAGAKYTCRLENDGSVTVFSEYAN